ncbi:MAG: aspartate/glutamate racemase family protein [Sediminispirochaetaceae bacterium]
MEYRVKKGQVSYGEAIGIVLLENYAPYVPGDVANATSYSYPVRFQRVEGFTPARIFAHDMTLSESVKEAALSLQGEGVRAVTGDCGFMLLYQEEIAAALDIPVFMSSLLQLPFILSTLEEKRKVGIITAHSGSLTGTLLTKAGVGQDRQSRLAVKGLENTEHFVSAVFKEEGLLDTCIVEEEVTAVARELCRENPELGAVLLECSLLPPYGSAVAEETGLPVFDYITMIDYVFHAVVKKRYSGFM